MGMSTTEDLSAEQSDEARMGERVVGLARRELPRAFALGARSEGGSGALKHQVALGLSTFLALGGGALENPRKPGCGPSVQPVEGTGAKLSPSG